jgi:hypothetical protein
MGNCALLRKLCLSAGRLLETALGGLLPGQAFWTFPMPSPSQRLDGVVMTKFPSRSRVLRMFSNDRWLKSKSAMIVRSLVLVKKINEEQITGKR